MVMPFNVAPLLNKLYKNGEWFSARTHFSGRVLRWREMRGLQAYKCRSGIMLWWVQGAFDPKNDVRDHNSDVTALTNAVSFTILFSTLSDTWESGGDRFVKA